MKQTDVLVVGGGPAGVGAALAAASCQVSVTLVDEAPLAGGHLRWSITEQPGTFAGATNARGVDIARAFDALLTAQGVETVFGGVAWGAFAEHIAGVTTSTRSVQYQAKHVIVATGSTDIVEPFPGWDLPGVMTATAALRLLHIHRVLPGRRAAVIGDGVYAAEVATALEFAGIELVARVDSCHLLEASGIEQVESVAIAGERNAVDCIVIAIGRQPDPELALQRGVELGYSHGDGCFVPLRNERLETSIAGMYAVGDCAGLCSAAEAFAEGTVAGLAAAGSPQVEQALDALAALRDVGRSAQLAQLRLVSGMAR